MELTLNAEQKRAVMLVNLGKNVFITGPAGTGKSFVIQMIIQEAEKCKKQVQVTASTGLAASLLDSARTLHSFMSIGLGDQTYPESYATKILNNKVVRDRLRKTDILILDECSMIDVSYFKMMDKVLRLVRLRSDKKPFGGLQLILIGDFFQLGPIKPSMELFNDTIWDETIHETVVLHQIYRQKNQVFVDLLMKLRIGEIDDSVCTTIQETTLNDLGCFGIKPTILYARNRDVDAMNREELDKLPGETCIFHAEDRDIDPKTPQRLPDQLALKVGAQVMILVNDDPEIGIVNGARGVVFNLDRPERIGVRLLSGMEVYLSKSTHETARDAPLLPSSRRQFPLKLAWAITIHKCQGMTIDYLIVDLAGCFAPGQAYTAISRGTQLENMTIRNFSRSSVITNHTVTAFHARCLLKRERSEDEENKKVKRSKHFLT